MCGVSITVQANTMIVLKICGKKGELTADRVLESHNHNQVTQMDLLADEFMKNCKTRANERVYGILFHLHLFHSKKSGMEQKRNTPLQKV